MPFEPVPAAEMRDLIRIFIDGPEDQPPHYEFAVTLKADNRLIGVCTVALRYDEHDQGEIYFLLGQAY
jgi:RimJ/RimL family protein N-acetyltransferase